MTRKSQLIQMLADAHTKNDLDAFQRDVEEAMTHRALQLGLIKPEEAAIEARGEAETEGDDETGGAEPGAETGDGTGEAGAESQPARRGRPRKPASEE